MAKQKEGVDKGTARKMIRSTEGCAKSITFKRNNKSDAVQLHDLLSVRVIPNSSMLLSQ
jgi:hypothetical protein